MQFFGGSENSPSAPPPPVSGNAARMMYVFNRNGVCLRYREWDRLLHTLDPQQDHKLIFGPLSSLKSLTAKMDPIRLEKRCHLLECLLYEHRLHTNTYMLSFMETNSGIKIILVTNPGTGDLGESLKYIYNFYVRVCC